MIIKETWAVDIRRIEQFFLSQNGVRFSETPGQERKLECCGCEVCLTPLSRHPVGPVSVPRTLVEITGEDVQAKALYDRFFLRFISAGG